jgi:hypothetical protein
MIKRAQFSIQFSITFHISQLISVNFHLDNLKCWPINQKTVINVCIIARNKLTTPEKNKTEIKYKKLTQNEKLFKSFLLQ